MACCPSLVSATAGGDEQKRQKSTRNVTLLAVDEPEDAHGSVLARDELREPTRGEQVAASVELQQSRPG